MPFLRGAPSNKTAYDNNISDSRQINLSICVVCKLGSPCLRQSACINPALSVSRASREMNSLMMLPYEKASLSMRSWLPAQPAILSFTTPLQVHVAWPDRDVLRFEQPHTALSRMAYIKQLSWFVENEPQLFFRPPTFCLTHKRYLVASSAQSGRWNSKHSTRTHTKTKQKNKKEAAVEAYKPTATVGILLLSLLSEMRFEP